MVARKGGEEPQNVVAAPEKRRGNRGGVGEMRVARQHAAMLRVSRA